MREVSTATAGLRPAAAAGALPRPDTRVSERHLLRPGWPLALLFYGFPLWWCLGLAHFIFFIVSVPMAIELMRRTPVRVPRWFGIWLLFLVWVLFSSLALWAHAPGTEYAHGIARVFGFGLNYMWYIAVTIVLLYVYNLRESELGTARVQRMAGFMFIVTALFGLAGTIDPSFEFKSLMEYVMPRGISHADFIHTMIHPALTSSSDLLGYEAARPIAPFMYANSWGNNLALYAPMFVASWFGAGAKHWRVLLGIGIVLLASIPVIHSLNRGMWLGIGFALVFAVLRFAIAGHTRPLNLLIVGSLVGTIGFLASPLYDLAMSRFEHPHSNERRGNLAGEVTSTALSSPFIGYGGTRAKTGSYASIAAADSSRCGSCGAPALGTQGYLWLLILGTGYIGTGLCLMFLLSQFLSAVRKVDPTSMVASVSILMSLIFFTVYDSLGAALFTLMIVIALHARANDKPHVVHEPGSGSQTRISTRRGRDLSDYVVFAHRHALVLVALTVAGGVIGGGIALTSTKTYAASTSVLMVRAPVYVDTKGLHPSPAVTVDTDAQLYSAPSVERAVSKKTGVPAHEVTSRLLITAAPLTRVLHVTFNGDTQQMALEGSSAAADAMLKERRQVIVESAANRLRRVRLNLGDLQRGALRAHLSGLGPDRFGSEREDRIQTLTALAAQLQDVTDTPGQVMSKAQITRVERARTPSVWGGSGAALGFLCALALASLRHRYEWFRRSRGRRSIPRVWDVPARGAR